MSDHHSNRLRTCTHHDQILSTGQFSWLVAQSWLVKAWCLHDPNAHLGTRLKEIWINPSAVAVGRTNTALQIFQLQWLLLIAGQASVTTT